MRRNDIEDLFGEDASIGLSISHSIEDPERCFSHNRNRKVRADQVKESDNSMHDPKEYSFSMDNDSDTSTIKACNGKMKVVSFQWSIAMIRSMAVWLMPITGEQQFLPMLRVMK